MHAAAISASVNGDVINIAAGTYNESNLNPDGKAITIQGTLNEDGTLATTIDAQQNARVFTINSGEGSGTVIRDLVITGGSTSDFGGGIFCSSNTNPTISNCTITGNTANVEGGGICCRGSNPTISNCTITDNMVTIFNGSGGGIRSYNYQTTISSSVICSNTPDQIDGVYTDSGVCIEQICNTCYEDADADGVLDYLDQCPGYDDNADADGDGTADGCDTCPEDPLNTDTDSDGTLDCIDGCPEDPNKTEPGNCGCGVAETNIIGDLDCDGDYDIDDIYAGMDSFGIETGSDCEGDANADGTKCWLSSICFGNGTSTSCKCGERQFVTCRFPIFRYAFLLHG